MLFFHAQGLSCSYNCSHPFRRDQEKLSVPNSSSVELRHLGISTRSMAMDTSTLCYHPWLLSLGVVFFLSSITALACNKRRRDNFLQRVQIHRRRALGASILPRSFSPSKQPSDSKSKGVVVSVTIYICSRLCDHVSPFETLCTS